MKHAILLLVAVVCSSPRLPAADPQGKIDLQVWDGTQNGNQTSYWVILAQQADLTPAFGINGWKDRGRFVFDELRSVADASQKTSVELLQRLGLQYQSF